jgi:hypothetical protein
MTVFIHIVFLSNGPYTAFIKKPAGIYPAGSWTIVAN